MHISLKGSSRQLRLMLPNDLLVRVRSNGSKRKSIKRYEETYRLGGRSSALWEIKTDEWFRKNWHKRKAFKGDMLKAVKDLAE